MRLHILTPVTRPENLTTIAASLDAWGDVDFTWHLRFDANHNHIGGYELRNWMIDEIRDGWVWCLDDDTIAHPDFYRVVMGAAVTGAPAVVVSQERPDGTVLHAAPENVMIGGIDIGQAVIRRDVIAGSRFPLYYAGDGDLFISLLANRDDVVFINEVLCWHNKLEPPEEEEA
jgi:hypothetical protein